MTDPLIQMLSHLNISCWFKRREEGKDIGIALFSLLCYYVSLTIVRLSHNTEKVKITKLVSAGDIER